MIESLESRRLLAAALGASYGVITSVAPDTALGTAFVPVVQVTPSATITKRGTLIVTGSDEPDTIAITRVNKKIKVSIGTSDVVQNEFFDTKDIKRLRVDANGGDDHVTVSNFAKFVTLMGGGGDDTLIAARNCTLIGGGGDDRLIAGQEIISTRNPDGTKSFNAAQGPSMLSGGLGDDTLSSIKDDVVVGGKGINSVVKPVTVTAVTKFSVTDDGLSDVVTSEKSS